MPKPDERQPWQVSVDTRDILAGAGATLVLIGAFAFHWAAAVVVVGAGLCVLSWRLSR